MVLYDEPTHFAQHHKTLYERTKSVGLTVLALMLLRVAWRWRHTPPALPPMPKWQLIASRISHFALYLLLLLMPLSGWLMNSATGTPMKYFGWFKVPQLIARSPEQLALWKSMHEACAWALCALIALHLFAVVKHQFIDRHALLQRMLPARKTHEIH
ncbi:cytochrome b [bacterium]|nr:cytochrome b [bacterium]